MCIREQGSWVQDQETTLGSEVVIYRAGYALTRRRQWQPTAVGTLAWQIPWTVQPGGLQSMGSLGVGTQLSDFTFTFHFHALEKEMATHSSVLAWRLPGTGEPGGLPSMGSHRVRHDWGDPAAAAAAAACPDWSRLNLSAPGASFVHWTLPRTAAPGHQGSGGHPLGAFRKFQPP